MQNETRFIVIDDNHVNSFITERLLKTVGFKDAVLSFQDGNDALNAIRTTAESYTGKTILLVDLQMPLMSGFSLLEEFSHLPEDLRSRYTVYIVTSSINPEDVRNASQYTFVKKFVPKPLTASIVQEMLQA